MVNATRRQSGAARAGAACAGARRAAARGRSGRGARLAEQRPERHEAASVRGCESGTGCKPLGRAGSSVCGGGGESPAMPCEGSRGWLHTRLLINTPDTHYKKKNQAEPQLNTKLQPSRWRGERRGPPTLLADPRCKLRVMPSLARGFSRLLHGQAPATSSPQLAAFALGHLPAC